MRIVLLTMLLLTSTACTPTHVIRPYPNFIQAGVKSGDKVTIETVAGETVNLKVSTVGTESISGNDKTVAYKEIRSINKRAWQAPDVPCGGEQPLGCSIPEMLTLINGVTENTQGFEPACVQHDFC
ncbi:MAG: hypothetical protein AAF438_19370, partial [Pseudomonadota bacterium]